MRKLIYIISILLVIPFFTKGQGLIINNTVYVIQKGGTCVVINRQANDGITRTGTATGGIINNDNNENNYVSWIIGTGSSNPYSVPWMSTDASPIYIPFVYTITSPGTNAIGSVLFSTWRTQSDNKTAVAGGVSGRPTGVINTDDQSIDNSLNTIDRYWWVKFSGYITSTVPQATLSFYYVDPTDFPAPNNIVSGGNESSLFAQHWDGSQWVRPGMGTDNSASNYVSGSITSQTTNTPWTLSLSTSPLPIKLLSFNAVCEENSVSLNWSTASETNNNYFTIERSKDAQTWESIATVNGAGNSNATLYYSATDNQPYPDYTYYRLKQTDYNGTFTYSNVIIAECGSKVISFNFISIANNPQGGDIVLSFTANEGEQFTYALYDMQGKLLKNETAKSVVGMNEIHIPAKDMSNSIYIVTLQNDTRSFSKKIFISNQYK